jgi:ABC-type oligopeptide transport system ATPase subunit
MFQKAVKEQGKLRLSIAGPSGSGKTYTALTIGTRIAELSSGRVAFLDTEHGSASKYADIFDFDVLDIDPPFHPNRFTEAIQEAGKAGYKVVIIDSLSHAWFGDGGLLDLVEMFAKKERGNSYAAWKHATPIQNAMIDAIVRADMHIIACMRSKQDYVLEKKGDSDKTSPRKVGMAPIQRDGMEYEFDIAVSMTIENDCIVDKTRMSALNGMVYSKPGAKLAEQIYKWLNSGEAAKPRKVEQVEITPEELRKEVGTKIKNRLAEIGINVTKDFPISAALASVDVQWANEIGAAITAQDWAKALTVDMSEAPAITKIAVPNGTTVEELVEMAIVN